MPPVYFGQAFISGNANNRQMSFTFWSFVLKRFSILAAIYMQLFADLGHRQLKIAKDNLWRAPSAIRDPWFN